ncbi:MAG TPA: family 1 glycosylhydrolase [Acidimicrobiales bacterium]|nr:family 1 glycosylhydrolase [Acidimicrobiales bacterium]
MPRAKLDGVPASAKPRRATPARRRPQEVSLLGEGFAVGVSTAGFGVEGGYNGHGEPHNNWASWEHTGRAERSGVACDFWQHPEEVLDRAAAIGCNTFRLSVEWARLEPEPGHFDQAALERYAEILTLCAARGLQPMVTLHHFSHPWWLGEEFWLRPASPDTFLRHVERVLPVLAQHCRHWVTINEPNTVMVMGWMAGAHPPGRRMAVADAYCVLDNLLTAHVLAAGAILAVQPDAMVTCNTRSSSVYEHDRLLTDLLLLRSSGVGPGDVDRYVDERRTLHNAAHPPRHAGEMALRRSCALLCPYGNGDGVGGAALWTRVRHLSRRPAPRRVIDAVLSSPRTRPLGAIGIDWDDPEASHALRVPGRPVPGGSRDWSVGRAPWDIAPDSPGLRTWCRTESAFHPGLPLWVVENGMASRVEGERPLHRPDGWDRPRFLRQHLASVADAVAAGVPIRAYLHRSLVDSYEWGSYRPRRGLFGVDRSDPAGAIRWMDTDVQGDDSAGEFSRIVRGLVAGDRSVLGAP